MKYIKYIRSNMQDDDIIILSFCIYKNQTSVDTYSSIEYVNR